MNDSTGFFRCLEEVLGDFSKNHDEPTSNLDSERRINLSSCILNIKGFEGNVDVFRLQNKPAK